MWIAAPALISANLGAQDVIGMGASGAKYGIATCQRNRGHHEDSEKKHRRNRHPVEMRYCNSPPNYKY